MAAPSHYALHVLRAQDVIWDSKLRRKGPDLYVKVKLDEIRKQTRTVKKNLSPTWNETFTFSPSSPSGILNIQVKHKSIWSSDPCVGYIDIELADLLKVCNGGEGDLQSNSILRISYAQPEPPLAKLSLHPPPGNRSGLSTGIIYLHLETLDQTSRAGMDVEAVGQAVQQSGIDRSARAADSAVVAFLDRGSHLTEGDLYKSLGALCSKLDVIVKIIDHVSRIHPYLNAAWQLTAALYKGISNQFRTDKKVVDLVHVMEAAFDFVRDTQTLRSKTRILESPIIKLLQKTTDCCVFLQKYMSHNFAGRMLDPSVSKKLDEFLRSLIDDKNALNSSLALHNAVVASRTSEDINALFLQQRLNINGTVSSSRQSCLKDTRVEIRRQIIDLLDSEASPNIIWLHGVAGSGKSTIATTIEDYFRDMSRLGGFLLFERGKSGPSSVIRTIAFKLALFDSSVGSHITDQVNQDKDIVSALLARQFEKLLLQPLTEAVASAPANAQEPVIIVLDALDECGTPHTRRDLMRLLKDEFHKLPPNFRFLITSRPESDIMKALSSRPNSVYEIELDYTSDASRRDVLSYLHHEMHEIVNTDPEVEVPKEWPWDSNLALLGEAAGGLFIWASTAAKLVSISDSPFRKLKGLVSDSRSLSRFGLDELYASVLRSSGIAWDDDGSRSRFSRVLALLLFSKIPLSNKTVDGLLGFPTDEPSHLILSRLRCLLAYNPGEPIRLFHTSFSDYLQSPERSNDPWFIDIPVQKHFLATQCFAVMENLLHFNICNLETSFVRNDDVTGLEDRIKNKIPPHLDYACHLWAQHLGDVPYSPNLFDKLSAFVYQRLLFWFEVLSLLKKFHRVASQALSDAATWTATPAADISLFLRDASTLATVFAGPITQSTPHIYVSMLPLTKEESQVAAHYSSQTSSVVRVDRKGTKVKALWLKALEGHTAGVWSASFSADGKRIVSGSEDKTIRIWDVESGEIISGPFEGHTDGIFSVAFARNGSRVVSGSKDKTLRVWDAESGSIISGPFEGHTGSVTSVAFSADGEYIVSGSLDKTIRVWDTKSGKVVSGPFEGHTDSVKSVTFSPSGTCIASGSDDKTVRVWDVKSGKAASEPFRGHSNGIASVAFSPDGTRIVSGSRDQTIRVWDTTSGAIVAGPFVEHTECVWSVAFSPDGSQIVSGSNDNTVRVWDAERGDVISGPFRGHSGGVLSVAFSPDGSHIVSGSWDQSVRVWDAASVDIVCEPFDDHTDSVLSVVFSPDGSKIASGSWDKTVRVWDVESECINYGLLEGHTDAVWSVSFSPDGTRLVSGSRDSTIRVWDAASGDLVPGPYRAHTDGIFSVAFSPGGSHIVSGSNDKTIVVWDAERGVIVAGPFVGHTDGVWSVAFSPDGLRVVSGSRDKTIIVWDAASGNIIWGPFERHTDTIFSVAFSPDGKFVASGSLDKTIKMWSAANGDFVSGSFEGHTAGIWSIDFSPDGTRIASGSRDNTIRVWDVASGNVIFGPFEGHMESIYSVAFSRDGKCIVSGSRDKTIRVWDAESRSTSSGSFEGVTDIAFSSDDGDFSSWTLAENGWVVGRQRELLLWVPPDLRPTLWRPQNTAIFSCAFWTKLDFQNTALGARWCECFKSSQCD